MGDSGKVARRFSLDPEAVNELLLDFEASQWQIRPLPGEPMATHDHTDFRWDDRVLDALGTLAWFELHEDLIATLGLQRGDETSDSSGG